MFLYNSLKIITAFFNLSQPMVNVLYLRLESGFSQFCDGSNNSVLGASIVAGME